MKRSRLLLFILTLLVGGVGATLQALGQGPGVSIGFHNDTKGGILVQGATIVNGVPRPGQPFLVTPGKTGYDSNVPQGMVRYITIYDSTMPTRVLLLNAQVQVTNRDQVFSVRPAPKGQVKLVPKK